MGWAPSACSVSRRWPRASSTDSGCRVSMSPSSFPPCTWAASSSRCPRATSPIAGVCARPSWVASRWARWGSPSRAPRRTSGCSSAVSSSRGSAGAWSTPSSARPSWISSLRERGIAMGIKQMGLTVGGIISALTLPPIASALGWRTAVATCAVVMGAPALASWPFLSPLARMRTTGSDGAAGNHWWWLRRPPLLALFAAGLVLGMVQSALLAYLPLYGVQVLGLTAVAAGALVAAAQAGGAVARLGLGAASDRWLGGRRPPWLVVSSLIGTSVFVVYAVAPLPRAMATALLAFAAGIGAHGWVGIYFIASAEAGGARQSGLLNGVSFAAIVVGLLLGAPLFGSVLEASDSYSAAWGTFAGLCAAVATVMALLGGEIHSECARARGQA